MTCPPIPALSPLGLWAVEVQARGVDADARAVAEPDVDSHQLLLRRVAGPAMAVLDDIHVDRAAAALVVSSNASGPNAATAAALSSAGSSAGSMTQASTTAAYLSSSGTAHVPKSSFCASICRLTCQGAV
jgi:hypothetical protein